MEEIKKQAILRTLEAAGGNKTQAARMLGIGVRTIHAKLREYGIK
jgi:two-component system response regulator HydG